tara:strand:- start:2878 stop:3114 length:237 start_codon:yes stop_codon:yes gene_type:complete
MDSNYVICNIIDLDNIDYSQMIGNKETVRYNFGKTKFIVEYEGDLPTSIQNLENPYTVKTKAQMLVTLLDEEWELDDR